MTTEVQRRTGLETITTTAKEPAKTAVDPKAKQLQAIELFGKVAGKFKEVSDLLFPWREQEASYEQVYIKLKKDAFTEIDTPKRIEQIKAALAQLNATEAEGFIPIQIKELFRLYATADLLDTMSLKMGDYESDIRTIVEETKFSFNQNKPAPIQNYAKLWLFEKEYSPLSSREQQSLEAAFSKIGVI